MTYAPADLLAVQRYLHVQTAQPWDALGIIHGTPQGGGYHEGHDLLHAAGRAPEDPGSDYSYAESQRDRRGLTDAGSAMDIGDGFDRFREVTLGLVAACQRGDPRTRDIREVIYTPDGRTVRRFDRLGVRSSGDSSHLTHTHTSFFRDSEGRRDQADNFLGLLRELFEGVDMANAAETNASRNSFAAAQLQPSYKVISGDVDGAAEVTVGNPLAVAIKDIKTALSDLKAASGQAALTLTDADRAAIVAALAGAVPTAAEIATAVLDEQHRRDEA